MVALLCGWVRFSSGQSSTKPLHISLKPFAQKSGLHWAIGINDAHFAVYDKPAHPVNVNKDDGS